LIGDIDLKQINLLKCKKSYPLEALIFISLFFERLFGDLEIDLELDFLELLSF
jgi:hypothetical protein